MVLTSSHAARTGNGDRETVADQLRRVLSEEIVTGVLGPGVRLDEQGLADRFQVSRTPIREALSQLSALGLVEKRPHKGVIVLVQSQERLLQLFEVMAELEGACARFAAERMDSAERDRLLRLHGDAAGLVEANDVLGYEAHNTVFHQSIYDGAHNPALVEFASDARRRVFHFRSAQFRVSDRVRLSHEEHGAIVDAVLGGNGEAAYAAARNHILIVRRASAQLVARTAPRLAQ